MSAILSSVELSSSAAFWTRKRLTYCIGAMPMVPLKQRRHSLSPIMALRAMSASVNASA